ncbi:MAG: phospholipase [Myxococcota bacterium]
MRTTIAGLDVQVLQDTKSPPSAAVILCHGFGAPGDDLVGLQRELVSAQPSLASTRFYFPAAPLSLGGFGWGDSRAWWMIDLPTVARLQQGDPEALREFRKQEPEGMAQARSLFKKLVVDVATQTGLPMKRLVLGGFSQGAMLATDVALRLEEAPGGLAILSGTLLLEDQWRAKAKARAGLPVFQAHGRQDPLLGFQAALWLRDLLTEGGLAVEFHAFDGGHGIAPDIAVKLAAFLSRVTR